MAGRSEVDTRLINHYARLERKKGFSTKHWRCGTVQLSGHNPTHITFQDDSAAVMAIESGPWDFSTVGNGGTLKLAIDGEAADTATVNATAGTSRSTKTAATVTGSETTTFDFSAVGDGGTFIVNPDAAGNDTATFNAAAGRSVSGASPSTNISAEVDTKLKISVDGDTAEEVTLTLTGLTSGAAIATQMQTAIRALGGKKALVTVDYDTTVAGKYAVLSPTLGTSSAVVITHPASGSVLEELKLGQAGGSETAGTGDCADISAVTAAEVIAVINADIAAVTASNVAGAIKITSNTTGIGSSLVIGEGTLNTALGFTESASYKGTPLIDISGGSNTTFKLKMSASDTAEDVTVSVAGLNSGAAIATALQVAIRALEGEKTDATVAYSAASGGSYTITSAALGTASNPVVTAGATHDLSADLAIGAANGGTETAGTGDCADISAVTPAELALVINTDIAGCSAVAGTDSVTLTSATSGDGSSIVVSDGTLNTALSLTENDAAVGAIGLGYETDMLDALYDVTVTQCLEGSETIATDTYAVKSKATTGFDIYASTATSTNHVNMTIVSRSPLFDS